MAETPWATVQLGHDLHLAVVRTPAGFTTYALDNDDVKLDALAFTTEPPSDAILSAARATAILLYAEHVEPPRQAAVDDSRPPAPHPFDRDRSQSGFHCKHCSLDAHHGIHNVRKAPRP